MTRINSIKSGYTMIELIFYVVLFAVLTLAVINALVTMTRSFRETSIYGQLGQNAAVMERMGREIRRAVSIASISSSDLKLNTTDDTGASKTIEFLLSGSNVQLLENNVLTGNLNSPNITVTALNFTQITTAKGVGVKITLTVKSNSDALGRTVDFYDTVVLRGKYAG